LGVFENRVLRRIFGTKRVGVAREWTELIKEKQNCVLRQILSRSLNQEDRYGWDVEQRKIRNTQACRVFVGERQGETKLENPMHRSENNTMKIAAMKSCYH
jgi:hypothetical protein